MTDANNERLDRIERHMEFIVEHQAKFLADIGRINATLDRHSEAIDGLIRVSQALVDHQTAGEGRMARIESKMVEVEEKMVEMAEAHRETEERLSTFITFVEKYLSSHNGR